MVLMQPKDSIQARYIAYWLTERGFHVAAMEVMTAISVDVLRKKIESTQQSSPDQFPTSEVSEQSAGPNNSIFGDGSSGPEAANRCLVLLQSRNHRRRSHRFDTAHHDRSMRARPSAPLTPVLLPFTSTYIDVTNPVITPKPDYFQAGGDPTGTIKTGNSGADCRFAQLGPLLAQHICHAQQKIVHLRRHFAPCSLLFGETVYPVDKG